MCDITACTEDAGSKRQHLWQGCISSTVDLALVATYISRRCIVAYLAFRNHEIAIYTLVAIAKFVDNVLYEFLKGLFLRTLSPARASVHARACVCVWVCVCLCVCVCVCVCVSLKGSCNVHVVSL